MAATATAVPRDFSLTLGTEITAPASHAALKDCCNLGYADCARVPAARAADAVRFAVAFDAGDRIIITWLCERAHALAGLGTLEWNAANGHGGSERWGWGA